MKEKKKICGCCKGKGGIWQLVKDLSGKKDLPESHYVECPIPGCHNGIVDLEENSKAF